MKAAVVFAVALALGSTTIASATTDSYPPPVKACGSIQHAGKPLAVDIDEADGGAMLLCAEARIVMTRYLSIPLWRRKHPASFHTLRYGRLWFSCYISRPDGLGWDYHCNTTFPRHPLRFVDIGAGRRGHLCRLKNTAHCPPR